MAYDKDSPATGHAALTDITKIRDNCNALRSNECGTEPSNLVAGMTWADNTGSDVVLKIRNKANDAWLTANFPSGTRMLFCQAAAPTGWTQITTAALNDRALRLVTGGTGGSTGGSRGVVTGGGSVGETAVTSAQMPAHTHTTPAHTHDIYYSVAGVGGTTYASISTFEEETRQELRGYMVSAPAGTSGSTGSGNTHTHTLALKYVDVIMAEKD